MPGPTSREHPKLIGVEMISLGTNYSFYCLECCQFFIILITSYRVDCMMCCPTNKAMKSDTKSFLALGGLHEDKLGDILQAMAPTNVETVHQASLFHIESNPDRFGLLAYPRPAFPATKRTSHAPISFDQQAQVSQGHTLIQK